MDSRHHGPYSPRSPKIARHQLAQKTISDGTKLPLVVELSRNHYGWGQRPDLKTMAQNTSRLSCAYERFLSGDPSDFAELLAPEAVYHLPGLHLGGGTLKGRKAILECAVSAALSFDASPEVRLLSVSGTENFVASVERATFRRGGRILEQRICVVWRFRDNQCVEIWSHFEDQAACDSFWNGWKPD